MRQRAFFDLARAHMEIYAHVLGAPIVRITIPTPCTFLGHIRDRNSCKWAHVPAPSDMGV